MKKICPNCGAETEGNFCPDCGTNLSSVMGKEEQELNSNSADSNSIAEDADIIVNSADISVIDNQLTEVSKDDTTTSQEKEDAVGTISDKTDSMSLAANSQVSKKKKVPKKLIGIIIAVVVLAAVAAAVFMFMGTGTNVISKAYEEGTSQQKIGELSYNMPASWGLDDTYSNPNEFYTTQRYLVKADDGSDSVDCYVRYCGESRYYGNSLEDYANKDTGNEVVSDETMNLSGAEGRHICTSYTDTEGKTNYVDMFLVEANGSIFSFEFDTNEDSHDQNGMNTILSNAQFGSYKTPVKDAIVGKGKYTDTANTIMRELICAMNKNNDSESLGCGEFSYTESSTKGGALCYSIKENGFDTGVAISFYKDKKNDNPVDSFDEIPVSVALATNLQSLLDYQDTTIALINGTFVQITGDVKYKQGYSKFVNGVGEATGISSQNWYTNSFSLNDFDYDLAVSTESGSYAVYMDVK